MIDKGARVAVGLSGGVDSSVAAALLKTQGWEVIGIMMEIYDASFVVAGGKHACYGPGEKEEIARAASVCKKLDIPFYRIDLKKEYRKHVIDYFKMEYLQGRTPNPCIVCNQKLKFGFLADKAREKGIDFSIFATGHYARITKTGERFQLKKALDLSKDQSYFLYGLRPDQLRSTLFPVGELTKQKVRNIARSMGMATADMPESQDFIEGGDYSKLFTEKEMGKGRITNENGNILGEHEGIIHYTVGQRRGLGVAWPKPLYVKRVEANKNMVIVGEREELLSGGLIAKELNFIEVPYLEHPQKVKTKIRLRHKEADSTIYPYGRDRARVVFDEPQTSVAPGQSIVFYSGDCVYGGGIIEKAF